MQCLILLFRFALGVIHVIDQVVSTVQPTNQTIINLLSNTSTFSILLNLTSYLPDFVTKVLDNSKHGSSLLYDQSHGQSRFESSYQRRVTLKLDTILSAETKFSSLTKRFRRVNRHLQNTTQLHETCEFKSRTFPKAQLQFQVL